MRVKITLIAVTVGRFLITLQGTYSPVQDIPQPSFIHFKSILDMKNDYYGKSNLQSF